MSRDPIEIRANREGGLPPIDWRPGAYASYLESMIVAAHSTALPDGPSQGAKPLESLNTAENDNFALGLLQCFATVGEILSFYSERILNESYLATAQERRSLTELVRVLGYQVRPGVSANVLLSIEPAENPGTTGDPVVPKGTRIQSVPGPGAAPQIFETTEDIQVRHAWTETQLVLGKEKFGVRKNSSPANPAGYELEIHIAGTRTGLIAGDAVLLIPEVKEEHKAGPYPWEWFATLKEVQPQVEAGFTRLVLQSDPDHPGIPVDWTKGGTFRIVAFRRTGALFGHTAPPWDALPDEVKLTKGGTVNGGVIFPLEAAPDGNAGLPLVKPNDVPARAVLAASDGSFFAGTGSGVYRRRAGSLTWEPVNKGLAIPNIYSLAEGPDGILLAGAIGAVFVSGDEGESWEFLNGPVQVSVTKHGSEDVTYTATLLAQLPPSAVRCIAARKGATSLNATTVYAGTDIGVFVTSLASGGWTALPVGTGDQPAVTALLAGPDGALLAATARGIYRLSGTSWESFNNGLPTPLVTPTALVPGVVAVGPVIYSLPPAGSAWTQLAALPEPVQCLARDAKGRLFAGTTAGLYRLDPGAASGPPIACLAGSVRAIAAGPSDSLITVQPYLGINENEWPDFFWTAGDGLKDLDIDAIDDRIAPDSWVLLQGPVADGRASLALFRARDISLAYSQKPWFSGEVTRMSLESEWQFAQTFPIRGTTVYFQSEELQEIEETPKLDYRASTDGTFSLPVPSGWLPPPGRTVVVSGEPSGPAGAVPYLKTTVVPSEPGQGSSSIRLQPASDTPKGLKLNPSKIRFHANVVGATQGEAVLDETIGSGDASLAHQSFMLKRWPLAFVDPGRTGQPQWTLTVTVNGVVWRRVSSFSASLPGDQVYIVALDDMGRATVTFGDGAHGARLPSGVENVKAAYRVCDPQQASVATGSLVNLLDRPLGIRAVTSIGDSEAPHKPETNDEIVIRATRFRRSWDRPISLRDYEDFATFRAGVGKAFAFRLNVLGRKGIHLTVAPRRRPDPPSESLLRPIAEDLRAKEAYPALLWISPFQSSPFLVSARVMLAPKQDWKSVRESIAAALMQRFGFEARGLNQPLTQSEVLNAITDVPGVAGALLTRFRRDAVPANAVEERLTPILPSWQPPNSFRGAEIFYIASLDSIELVQWNDDTGAPGRR